MGGKWRSRPDGAVSGADRSRTWRRRRIERGAAPTLFDRGIFVAVDGEGFGEGPPLTFSIGDGKNYTAQAHHYAYLAASDGSEVYSETRLATQQCLDFLLDIKAGDPLAILVTFGASYDFTQMLRDLDRGQIDHLMHGQSLDVTLGDHDYRLELRMRKQLSVWRWRTGQSKYHAYQHKSGERRWRLSACDKVTLWDVWGFFQGSFRKALDDWLPGHPDYQFIARMKGERSIFARADMADIRAYNQAELRCLVAMMELLRGSLATIGARISRWDGAGAVAAAMLRANGVQDGMAPSPEPVQRAALHAYSGGHIEAMQLGAYAGAVHHYDVNSAYPAHAAGLPDLANGHWRHGGADGMAALAGDLPRGFTLARVSWRFNPEAPFYPLFYRTDRGTILYPERGHGWYWLPEVDAAQAFADRFGAIDWYIHEYWHFEEGTARRPFGFIPEIYAERQRIIREAKARGVPDGRQIAIRLGLNAMYGKLAQQVGALRVGDGWRMPAYFQLEWAGWITSACRAQLMQAAMQKPDAIMAIATDGIFAIEPLVLDCPAEKRLGAWEYKCHAGMTLVMPGVYWTGETTGGDAASHFSRGFDKQAMADQAFVIAAWRQGKHEIGAASRRMITLGQALVSDSFWTMRGMFVETERMLRLDGMNSKRHGVAMTQVKPHKGLVRTAPQDLPEYYDQSLAGLLSEAYPVVWLNGGRDERLPVDPAQEGMMAAGLA